MHENDRLRIGQFRHSVGDRCITVMPTRNQLYPPRIGRRSGDRFRFLPVVVRHQQQDPGTRNGTKECIDAVGQHRFTPKLQKLFR